MYVVLSKSERRAARKARAIARRKDVRRFLDHDTD